MAEKRSQRFTPAKYAANRKYDAKTYKKIMIPLRYEEDAEIIADIEEAKENGINHREWLNSLFYEKK